MITITECTVLECKALGGTPSRFFILRLAAPGWQGEEWRPGQFVMLRPVSWGVELPLARPLSICMVENEVLSVFFQVMGKGTANFAALGPGETVRVLGPLGSWFDPCPDRPVLMLAGGMGLAPFLAYAQRHPVPRNLSLLFGHRPPLGCYPFDILRHIGRVQNYWEQKPEDLQIFLRAVEDAIQENTRQEGVTLACGPMPFLRAVREMSRRHSASTQLSLENRMACGIGACQACVVKPFAEGGTADRPLPPLFQQGLPVPVCMCGPVFWADTVDLG